MKPPERREKVRLDVMGLAAILSEVTKSTCPMGFPIRAGWQNTMRPEPNTAAVWPVKLPARPQLPPPGFFVAIPSAEVVTAYTQISPTILASSRRHQSVFGDPESRWDSGR